MSQPEKEVVNYDIYNPDGAFRVWVPNPKHETFCICICTYVQCIHGGYAPPSADLHHAQASSNLVTECSGRDEELNPTARFLAYASRVGRILGSSVRYSAYASDVGEAFRPIVSPAMVNATYAIAFGYVGCDILYNGYRASEEGRSVPRAVAHATVFQGLASLAAPFAIIHTTVSATTKLAAKTGSKTAMRFGPTVAGLAWIPLLPGLVDEPIEELGTSRDGRSRAVRANNHWSDSFPPEPQKCSPSFLRDVLAGGALPPRESQGQGAGREEGGGGTGGQDRWCAQDQGGVKDGVGIGYGFDWDLD